jgi:hypothetical protein
MGAQDAYVDRATDPEVVKHLVRMQGTGASAPTKENGRGVTITRLGVGNYRLTWAENPGNFLGFTEPGKQATSSGALKNTTVDAIAWDATNRRLDIQLWSSAGAARELAAAEWLTLIVHFKRAGTSV